MCVLSGIRFGDDFCKLQILKCSNIQIMDFTETGAKTYNYINICMVQNAFELYINVLTVLMNMLRFYIHVSKQIISVSKYMSTRVYKHM